MARIGVLINVIFFAHVHGKYNFKEGSVLDVIFGSFRDCTRNCDSRVACLDVLYERHLKICILYKTGIPLASKPNPLYFKDQNLIIEQQNVTGCDECARENCRKVAGGYSCDITVCSTRVNIADAMVFGNSHAVGAKLRYQCVLDTEKSIVMECLQNGSWSSERISCDMCQLQSISNGNWTTSKLNATHVYANVTCDTGYDLRMPELAVCDIKTGKWSSGLNWICCDVYTSTLGLKIYDRPAYIGSGIYKEWKDGKGFNNERYGKMCMHRNASVLDNWDSFTFDVITFRIIENDIVVASLKFNGAGSTSMNWFSKDRLLESSWHDLSKTSNTDVFSIKGNADDRRFYISKKTDPGGNCWHEMVWLVATYQDLPCGNTSMYDRPRVLYAKHNTVSNLTVDEIGFADKFEVWINPIP